MQKNTERNLETVWEDEPGAPGNERVRLRSVCVIPQTDPGEPITVHTPLQIEFTYWNYVPDTTLNVSMIVNTLEEVCAFASISDFAPRPAGLVRPTGGIPGGLLHNDSYYGNFLVVEEGSAGVLFQED